MTRGGGDITRATLEEMAGLLEQGGDVAKWQVANGQLKRAMTLMMQVKSHIDAAGTSAPNPIPDLNHAQALWLQLDQFLDRLVDQTNPARHS